ncbi:DNA polymerase III subunit alpha [Candidatus Saccharibacteria bacterium]|nr:DNA polymerase III subunit alpha [Candidatus Saccharibacteria bacterium]
MVNQNRLTSADFVHLHNHTQYSLLDGLTKVPDLMDYVKEVGMQAVAITDHGTMSGAIEFYKTAKATNIKPIIGMETYVAPRGHTDKDPSKDKTPFHLILLAMNNQGYENLMRLSSIANLDGFYYKPRIDHQLLQKYNQGLIVLSGCMGGEVSDALRNNQYEKAKSTAEWYKSVFGDRYYIEIQDHGHAKHPSAWDEQVEVTKHSIKLAKELNIPCVLTCDAHYLRHKDQEAHELLLCVQTGSFLSEEKRFSLKEFELHVTDPKEIIQRWGDQHPDFITNTQAIAERCEVNIELGRILIPKFPVPGGESETSYLHKLVYQGLAWRYGGIRRQDAPKLTIPLAKKTLPSDVLKRAQYELGVINDMGFNGYFLIVADFINWGKSEGIVFGPGRGSAAGSIIAYAMRITELDPIKYDLLFERFLNPDRISMPDVDIDIQDTRRDEVIQYCVQKYGKERVANIVTFGRMAARNAVRDVARVLEVPYVEADRLSKMIPPPVQGRHIPLATSLVKDADLKAEYESSQQSKRIFDLAVKMEGTIRSHGIHAAGVVIAPDEIVKFAPLELAQKGVVSTQYSMGPVEELGLLKMDFLGLSNLTIIKNALRIIKRVYDKDIDISQIPLDDQKTFELLQRGDTTGVFQLESAGMKRYLRELKPSKFDDIIAMVALYRPGPMQFIDDFIARKHGLKEVTYEHKGLESALSETYGILVYQEQFMQISKDMCGFTGGQADTLRKAIGKKQRDTMAKMKVAFIDGMVNCSKVPKSFAEKFWAQLEAFADYCFNKSHSACYGLIAYQTAYLKAHYPDSFMAALMTSDYDDIDRLAIEINECNNMGIKVLAPDVNESFVEFAVVPETHQIRFGMAAIKNVGTAAVEEILRARTESSFKGLEDFFERVNVRIVNRKALESLIKTGALDKFGVRAQLLENIDILLAYASRIQKEKASGQIDLFGNAIDSNDQIKPKLKLDELSKEPVVRDQLQWERELLGLYLSQHPLEDYKLWLREQTVPINELMPEMHNKIVTIGGVIINAREILTKNGQKMAFVQIADESDEIELILFPRIYDESAGLWQRDTVVVISGKISGEDREGNRSSEVKVLVDSAREVTHAEAKNYAPSMKKPKIPKINNKKLKITDNTKSTNDRLAKTTDDKKLYIKLTNSNDQKLLIRLKQLIDRNSGEMDVILVFGEGQNRQIIKLPIGLNYNEQIHKLLINLVGSDNIKSS